MTGLRPVIRARQGRMLGIRPATGCDNLTIGVMADHFDRGLGLSDARIERFKGVAG
jgi:hypothetical protein